MGSAAKFAVPVLENVRPTSGSFKISPSSGRSILTDWSMDVDGIRTEDKFKLCSSRVGMKTWPTKWKVTRAAAKVATAAPITGEGLATARRSSGS